MSFNFCTYILFLIFKVILSANQNNNNNIVSVNTKTGPINGRKNIIDDKEINVFLGIPYAKPPVGVLRFKKPLPIKQWTEPFDANSWPNPCYQIESMFEMMNNNFSEDCLYLNIWSPDVKASDDELRPVMFWIHGGALYMGSSSEVIFNADILSSIGDVVVVTFNYRLDAFGFLYTETDDAPGNMGLWDQALALEWVNNNIKNFGGNPKRITIVGHSAGSWSVSLHLLSPITRNLFQNAIMMSGAAFAHASDWDPEVVMNSWLIGAESIKCVESNSSYTEFTPRIMKCLRKADPELVSRIASLPDLSTPKLGWFRLTVIDGKFLPKKPIEMLKNGDFKKNVNLMVGSLEDEGSLFLNYFYGQEKYDFFNPQNFTYDEAFEELEEFSTYFPTNIEVNGYEVSEIYFNGLSNNNDFDILRRTIGIALGDFYLTCPTIRFAELLFSNDRNESNVFQYYYTSKLGNDYFCAKWMGACHGSELSPLFGIPLRSNSSSEREKQISKQMINLFANFARFGFPEPQNDIDFPSFYMIDENIMRPYYEISEKLKPVTNFGNGLKLIECEYLWKKYIES